MKIIFNTQKLKKIGACVLGLIYLNVPPPAFTSYLFSVDHPSIQNSSGWVESYSVIAFVWLLLNLLLIPLVAILYSCLYSCRDIVSIKREDKK